MTENSPYYADWYEYAREEFDMAEVALARNSLKSAAVHVHQALEKALKGFIIRNGERPPRTHDLIRLLDLAVAYSGGLRGQREWLEDVSDYYANFHYPSAHKADAEILAGDMAAAKRFLERIIAEPGRG